MPGGQKEAYDLVAPIFKAISAKVDGDPCTHILVPMEQDIMSKWFITELNMAICN